MLKYPHRNIKIIKVDVLKYAGWKINSQKFTY